MVGASFLPALMFVTFFEVVKRYVFNAPTTWSFETTMFLSGTMTFLGGAYCLRYGLHVNVDVLYERWSPKHKAVVDAVTFPLLVLLCLTLVWPGGKALWSSLQLPWEASSTPWGPVLWPMRGVIVIGGLLLFFAGAAKFIRDLRIIISRTKPNV